MIEIHSEMFPENGAALIGAAIISMSVFPVIALMLRERAKAA
jgi:hypothetical protein